MCVLCGVSDRHSHLRSWLRFRVQLLPHLRRQQLKLLRLDLWLAGGKRKPYTPPLPPPAQQFVNTMKDSGKHVPECSAIPHNNQGSNMAMIYGSDATGRLFNTTKSTFHIIFVESFKRMTSFFATEAIHNCFCSEAFLKHSTSLKSWHSSPKYSSPVSANQRQLKLTCELGCRMTCQDRQVSPKL